MLKIKSLALIMTVCLLVSIADPSHIFAKPLRVGYFKVAPHAMPGPQGAPQGVAVEYFRFIAQEMQLDEIEFIMLPLNRLLQDLEKNRVDMALLLARNAERVEKFVYPEKAFCVTKPSIAVSVSNPLQKVTAVEDLLPLAFHETPGNYHTAVMQDPRLRIEPLAGEDFTRRCYAMIVAGRIDACYQPDHYPIQFEAVREPFVARSKSSTSPTHPSGSTRFFRRPAPRCISNATKKPLPP